MVWPKGQQLQGGKYIIEKVLGHGGFGVTYQALALLEGSMKCPDCESTQLRKKGRPNGKQKYQCRDCGRHFVNSKALPLLPDQHVVIKTPHEYLKNKPDYNNLVDRFIQEGETLSLLSIKPHPHIVRFTDLFKEGESYCLVMDFVPGENLFELVNRKKVLPEAQATRYIRQIGEALVFVHQAGLVHRDTHPGNIILRSDDRAVLIDFGIAKEQVPSTLSSTGNVGNRGFAPYEQIDKGSREPTVDVYSLAATLYYVVTGQCPPYSLDRKFYKAALTPPNQIISDISDRLNQAILQGMALEAENRPQSMQEWLKLLEVPNVIISHLVSPAYKPPPSVAPAYKREVVHPPVTPTHNPPPPVAPAYKREAVHPPVTPAHNPPPPVAPAYKREAVHPSSDESSPPQSEQLNIQQPHTEEPDIQQPHSEEPDIQQPHSEEPDIQETRTIPWDRLAGTLLFNAITGCILTLSYAPLWTWTIAWTIAWLGAVASAGVLTVAWAGAIAMAIVLAVAGTIAGARAVEVAGAMVMIGVVAGAGAGSGAGAWYTLLKSFNWFHTFLILAGTSGLGLGLGRLVGLIVR
jgi:serine/threonine-protein kinase